MSIDYSSKNLYEVKKTISFYLEGLTSQENLSIDKDKYSLLDLYNNLDAFIENLKKYIYKNDGKYNSIIVKREWIKEFCKQDYYDYIDNYRGRDKNEKEFEIYKTKFIQEYIESWFINIKENLDLVKENLESGDDNKKRYSEISIWLKKIYSKSNFISIQNFLNNIKNDNQAKSLLEKSKLNYDIYKLVSEKYFANTIQGRVFLKGSFNYNTIGKESITNEEYNKQKKSLQDELEKNISQYINNINIAELKKYILNIDTLSLEEADKQVGEYKAKLKSEFTEHILSFVKQGYKIEDLKYEQVFGSSKYNLFGNDNKDLGKFKYYYLHTQTIFNENKKSQPNNKYIKEITKKRGSYYTFSAPNYKKYFEIYKLIRKKTGEINGKIKALEKQRLEPEITHWGALAKQNNKYSLLLVPKIIAGNIKGKITKSINSNNGQIEINILESFTYKSLEKRFKKDTSYYDAIKNTDTDTSKDLDKFNLDCAIQYLKNNRNNKNKDIINFEHFIFRDKQDNIIDKNTFINQKFDNLEDFIKKFNKYCYVVLKYNITETEFAHILNSPEIQLSEIKSYDLNPPLENENRENPEYFSNLWEEFIYKLEKGEYPLDIRLNPEFTIYYREKLSDQKTKFKRQGEEKESQNRRNEPKFRVFFSLSKNMLDVNLLDRNKGIEEIVDTFNQKFNQNKDSQFLDKEGYDTFYGIDRGSDEMATLVKVKFKSDKIYSVKNINDLFYAPKFNNFQVYSLKKNLIIRETEDLKNMLKNPSLYLKEKEKEANFLNEYFELKDTSSLDLTMAKLFRKSDNEYIILDIGDLYTYLNFKLANAKNKLINLLENKELQENTKLELGTKHDQTILQIQKNRGPDPIYFYKDNTDCKSIEEIQEELNQFLEELYSKDKSKIQLQKDSLLKYKKSLSSNMVGILNYLYQKDKGFFVFESLDKNLLDSQSYFKTAVHRQLEYLLYKKLQNYNTVPPRLVKSSVFMELLNQSKGFQLGSLLFLDEDSTSSCCPVCEEKNKVYKSSQKWQQHRFGCQNKNCGFDTGSNKGDFNIKPNLIINGISFESLNTSDSVASYNIAKSGLKFIKDTNLLN